MSNNYQFPVVLGSLAAGNQPLSDFDTDYDAAGRMGTLQCSVAGTNSLTLTALSGYPTMVGYGANQKVGFIATATSTTIVSLGYSGLALLNAYLNDGATRVGSGNIASGAYYEFAYNPALNSSAGGWQLISMLSNSSSIANNSALANISGGTAAPSAVNLATAGASEVLIGNVTASGSGSVTITNIPAGYDQYILRFSGVLGATASAGLRLRLSENNGVSYISTSTYNWGGVTTNFAGSVNGHGGANDSSFSLDLGTNASITLQLDGSIVLANLGSSSLYKTYQGGFSNPATSNGGNAATVGGVYTGDTNVVNAIQLFMTTGNIQTGSFALYGVRNA
jgi:hypothetical protein